MPQAVRQPAQIALWFAVDLARRLTHVCVFSLFCCLDGGLGRNALAQSLKNEQIAIAYAEPTKENHRRHYLALRRLGVLETLQAFLSPLILPRKIQINVEECQTDVKFYKPDEPVVICYEFVERLQQLAARIPPNEKTLRGVSRNDAIIGAFVQTALQHTAIAIFDVLRIPVWGREQDAADKLSAFLMLQFGPETSRRLLNGAAYFFEASDRTWTGSDFSDERGTDAQRFFNFLCIAYGSNRKLFADFSEGQSVGAPTKRSDVLTMARTVRCQKEYDDLKWAFDSLVRPHLDADRMNVVLGRDWLAALK